MELDKMRSGFRIKENESMCLLVIEEGYIDTQTY
ncbi:hypothetical protein BVRB_8g201780 [Beta vulgaris subsp. vulgaris]|uniref:Uncharacterized protein n=1 Tax=Beta vulgaris subsp. vulgaris TaxID=3555 RepID=A0A0J8B6G1_BETVV|nr:hypothetical protein BVRB_8g201780 [Beta vulgaris subsp. vulgaris]